MKPEERKTFSKVSESDYQAQMELALSSNNDNVREAIESAYSPRNEKN
ncbi:MAG: hypothetical protein LKF75_05380 [Bacilli bacterium]|jgi:hypothetical protein|nr:hypothetical protein [Bacilli bacterium]MCH4210768.1 hypothetical protein [Bacilli bacterium]MCH4229103.1 hypothetical protein [Bacilli bacterium]MCH4277958.1 hypothetical protein [Bacilli bacterium]